MNASAVARVSLRTSFFAVLCGLIAIVVFAGFSRTFFLRAWFPEAAPLAAPETFFYIHGTFFAAWIALLVAQPILIRSRRRRLHFNLGWVGTGLAAAMVPLGIYGALLAAHRPGGFTGLQTPPLEFLIFPVFDMLLFGLFVGLATVRRWDGQSHKRLMILATVNLLSAAIIRLPLSFIENGPPSMAYTLQGGFVAVLAASDLWLLRRLHPVTLWAGLLTVVSEPVRLWLGGTHAWNAAAKALVGLLG